MIDSFFQHRIKQPVGRLSLGLAQWGLTPNKASILGLFTGLASSVFIFYDAPLWALGFLCLSGGFDMVDGSLARLRGGGTPMGAFMDISFDRLVETALICTLAYKFPFPVFGFTLLLASIVLSITVFLTAGALVQGDDYKSFYYIPGLIERTETFIILAALILFPLYTVWITLIGAALILISTVLRFLSILEAFKNQPSQGK